jgi:hypothetical protein
MFAGILLRVLRLEVSIYDGYIKIQVQTIFALFVEVTVKSKKENS